MTSNQALQGMLGLACRAGQMQSGCDLAVSLIRSGKAALALMDENASPNTKKRILDSAAFYHVQAAELPGGMLENACGKPGRMVCALQKGGIADKIIAMINQEQI